MTDSPPQAGTEPVSAQHDSAKPDGSGGMSRSAKSTVEWIAVIVGALVVALVVKTFLIQAFYIPSESMLPTLKVGDRVLVNKLSYDLGEISRGDVVVFARPGGPGSDGIADLIKRVVALPGETVEGRSGTILVDGEAIDEGYLPPNAVTSDFGPQTIPIGHVWLMGDNRQASDDSRRFGPVPESDIVGKAFVTIWPIAELGRL